MSDCSFCHLFKSLLGNLKKWDISLLQQKVQLGTCLKVGLSRLYDLFEDRANTEALSKSVKPSFHSGNIETAWENVKIRHS